MVLLIDEGLALAVMDICFWSASAAAERIISIEPFKVLSVSDKPRLLGPSSSSDEHPKSTQQASAIRGTAAKTGHNRITSVAEHELQVCDG